MAIQSLKARIIAPNRLIQLADGVFAVAMTILVLELSVPIVKGASVNTGLTQGLLDMWPEFLIYGLGFFVVGVFWLMHHFIFDSVMRYDAALSWINIFFLMCTGLIPFSTALFGAYGAEQITALVYGINMFLGFLGLWALWLYATGKHRLVDTDLGRDIIRGANLMAIAYMVTILIALGITFVNPVVSFIMYFLIVLAVIILTAIGKWELVTTLPVRQGNDKVSKQEESDN
jgi:uncharacterized membrane protein